MAGWEGMREALKLLFGDFGRPIWGGSSRRIVPLILEGSKTGE